MAYSETLVERLLRHVSCLGPCCENAEVMFEAAKAIETLSRENAELRKLTSGVYSDSLVDSKTKTKDWREEVQ